MELTNRIGALLRCPAHGSGTYDRSGRRPCLPSAFLRDQDMTGQVRLAVLIVLTAAAPGKQEELLSRNARAGADVPILFNRRLAPIRCRRPEFAGSGAYISRQL